MKPLLVMSITAGVDYETAVGYEYNRWSRL